MSHLRYALRTLLRTPAFTLAVAVVLALGMGATTAIYTLVHSLLLEPLPYPDCGRLVWIWNVPPRSGTGLYGLLGGDFLEVRDRTRSFDKMAGLFPGSWNVTGAGEPQRLSGARVTEQFFETLGVQPMLGRAFRSEEHSTGREMVVIFSHNFWRRHFGGDPGVVGGHITMDGIPYEVVGVMPPEFPLAAEYDLWAPLPRDSTYATGRRVRWLRSFGRLKNGVRLEQAQAEFAALATDFEKRYPVDRGYSFKLVTFTDQEVGGVRRTLWIFAAAVGCVLLIACSNVASLLLARGAVRVREMAVRAAIGATRGALIRQLLLESALMALAGGVLGFFLATGGVRLLVALDPRALPRAQQIHADAGVLAFAFLLSLATGLAFGIVPALRASRVDLNNGLKEGGRSATAGRQGNHFRAALVVIEVALGVVLMSGAGLLARSFRALTEVQPGYDARNVMTMQIALTGTRYRDSSECVRFFERLLTEVAQMPGVVSAGSTNYLPLRMEKNTVGVWLDTQPVHDQESKILVDNRVVTPGYFRAMGVPLLAGRFFAWTDRPDTPKVMIVNDAFARQFFPRGDALGHRVTMDIGGTPAVSEIAGVVGSFRDSSLAEPPRPEIFTVYPQTTIPGQTLVVRSARDLSGLATGIRGIVASLDKDVPTYNLRTMQEQVDQSLAQPRMRSALLAIFSAVALMLASFGVFGVITCAVAERRQEIGIRMALGAQRQEVRRMMLVQGLKLTAIGLALGLIGAAAASRLLQTFLYGVSAADPVTFLGTAAVFAAVPLAASYLPARRATLLDPLTVLREE